MTSRLQKLFYRSVKRGTKENEMLLRAFAEKHLATLDDESIKDFEALLDCSDPDIAQWLLDPRTLPGAYDSPVFWLLKALHDRGIG